MKLLIKTLCLSNTYFFLNIREVVTLSFYVEMLTLFFFKVRITSVIHLELLGDLYYFLLLFSH